MQSPTKCLHPHKDHKKLSVNTEKLQKDSEPLQEKVLKGALTMIQWSGEWYKKDIVIPPV